MGVSTNCCVLSTNSAAIDDGFAVTVVSDACAGDTKELHKAALQMMASHDPLVSVRSTNEVLATP